MMFKKAGALDFRKRATGPVVTRGGQRYVWGERSLTITEWAREPEALAQNAGVRLIRTRLANGWSVEHAITVPRGESRPGVERKPRVMPTHVPRPAPKPSAYTVPLERPTGSYRVPKVGEKVAVIWGPLDELVEVTVRGKKSEKLLYHYGRGFIHRTVLCDVPGYSAPIPVALERFPVRAAKEAA